MHYNVTDRHPFGRSGHNRILNILQSIGRCSVTPVRSRFTLVLLRHTATDKLSRNDTAIVLCRQMETRTAHELHTPPFETGTNGVIHEILILETQIQQCQLVRVTLRVTFQLLILVVIALVHATLDGCLRDIAGQLADHLTGLLRCGSVERDHVCHYRSAFLTGQSLPLQRGLSFHPEEVREDNRFHMTGIQTGRHVLFIHLLN